MPHDYILTSNGELYHYGVLGMKWGVRRYQDKNGRLTAAGKARLKDRKVNKKIEDYVKAGKAKVDDLDEYKVGKLTSYTNVKTGEKFVSAIGNVGDFLIQDVINLGTKDDPSYENAALALKEAKRLGFDLWRTDESDDVYHERGALSPRDLELCNLGRDRDALGTHNNCVPCSMTLELRKRGINVSAERFLTDEEMGHLGIEEGFTGSYVDAPTHWFKGAKRVDYTGVDVAQEALSSYGPMTSGSISMRFQGNAGGHSMHWTNDADGKFTIEDGQVNRTFNSIASMMSAYGGDTSKAISTFRLDNCEPDYDNMARDGVIRASKETLGYGDEPSAIPGSPNAKYHETVSDILKTILTNRQTEFPVWESESRE